MKVNTEKVTAAGVPVQLGDRNKYIKLEKKSRVGYARLSFGLFDFLFGHLE